MNTNQRCHAVAVPMLPKDTNGTGTNIFGGVIMSYMDLAAGVAAHRLVKNRVVTKVFREINFMKPVFVGDVLTCYAEVTKIGKTSLTISVVVEAERKGEFVRVTEGEAVFVAVDKNDRPVPLIGHDDQPPTLPANGETNPPPGSGRTGCTNAGCNGQCNGNHDHGAPAKKFSWRGLLDMLRLSGRGK
jgi:acyl-CoA thioesterase YciA